MTDGKPAPELGRKIKDRGARHRPRPGAVTEADAQFAEDLARAVREERERAAAPVPGHGLPP